MTNDVLIVGGGVAGLTAAIELAQLNLRATVVEKGDFPGGHAIRFTCKATNACVKCGACMAEEKLKTAVSHPGITILPGSRVREIAKDGRFSTTIETSPRFIDPVRCSNCGICFDKCPFGAIQRGFSAHHLPWYALSREKCRYVLDGSCTVCRDACPERAISLDKQAANHTVEADAVIIATGFQAFDPIDKPYGYDRFPNVVTNLELERILRRQGRVKRPSDGKIPGRIAFIQCVGSRDAKLGHLWCSKVCCGSALRMARLIKKRQPDTALTVFYMDIQTFGKDFKPFYDEAREEIQFQRAIPADIFPDEDDGLRVTYFDQPNRESRQEQFDLVSLSVGLLPGPDTAEIAQIFGLSVADNGFLDYEHAQADSGVFVVGTAREPMSIAETVAGAGQIAWQVHRYLNLQA